MRIGRRFLAGICPILALCIAGALGWAADPRGEPASATSMQLDDWAMLGADRVRLGVHGPTVAGDFTSPRGFEDVWRIMRGASDRSRNTLRT